MKIKIELELEDVFTLLIWRAYDKQTFTPTFLLASIPVDKVIDKIADQVEPIVNKMEG